MTRYIIFCLVYILPSLCCVPIQAQTEHYVIRALIPANNSDSNKRIRIGKRLCTENNIISNDAIIQWGNIRQMIIYNVNNKREQYVLNRIDFKYYKTIAQFKSQSKNKSEQRPGGKRLDVSTLRKIAEENRNKVYDYDIKDSISAILLKTVNANDFDANSIRLLQGVIDMADKSIKAEFSIDSTSIIINNEKRLALIIGNSDYSKETKLSPLETPCFDAEDISEILRDSLGFDVITVLNRDSTCIMEHIDAFVKSMNKFGYQTGLFYYAGHGGSFNNVDFIIPIDRKCNVNISYQDIVAKLQSGKLLMVIFDACRSKLLTGKDVTRLDKYGKDDKTLIMTSVGSGVPADDGVGNSPFAKAFMSGICQENASVLSVLGKIRERLSNNPTIYEWDTSKKGKKGTENYMLRPVKRYHPYCGINLYFPSIWGIDLHGGIQWDCGLMLEGGIQLYGGESEKLYTYNSDFPLSPTKTYFGRKFGIFARGGYDNSRWIFKKGSEIRNLLSMVLYGEGSFVYVNNYSWGFYYSPNFRLGYNITNHWQVHGDLGYVLNIQINKKFEKLPDDAPYKKNDFRFQLGINYKF